MKNLIEEILNAPYDQTSIFSVGQAGFIFKLKTGELLGLDLYLSDCVERVEENHVGYKRLLPKLFDSTEIVLDYVFCSHFHRDHFDIDSIPKLHTNKKTLLICAEDCKQDVEDLKIDKERVVFVAPGRTLDYKGFKLHIINCDHGQGAPKAVGLIIEVDGKRILIVGDTRLRLDRKEEYLSYGPIDVLIAPINGMYGNLNEEECAILANELDARLVIPSHYGMFAAHRGDIGLFHNIMKEKYPNRKYLIMCQGEKYSI